MATYWCESFAVRSFDVDLSGQMRLTSLIRHMQNAADGHARSHGLAVDQLLAQGKTWVLREFQVEVFRAPRQEEQCRVTTWAAPRSAGARAWRDYTIETVSGERLAAGASLWLMLETEKWRPIRLTADVLEMVDPGRPCPLVLADTPECDGTASHSLPIDVHWLDLDANGHVNNVRYIDWMMAGITDAMWEEWEPQRFAALFLDEARFGETLSVTTGERGKGRWDHGIRNRSGKVLCRGCSQWRKRN